jgi:hypothetical protein
MPRRRSASAERDEVSAVRRRWASCSRRSPKTTRETQGTSSDLLRLSKLTTASLDRYYRSLLVDGGRNGRPLAPGSIRRIHGILRRALGAGRAVGLARREPGRGGVTAKGADARDCAADARAAREASEGDRRERSGVRGVRPAFGHDGCTSERSACAPLDRCRPRAGRRDDRSRPRAGSGRARGEGHQDPSDQTGSSRCTDDGSADRSPIGCRRASPALRRRSRRRCVRVRGRRRRHDAVVPGLGFASVPEGVRRR